MFTLKMSKYNQKISIENAFGECGFNHPPPLGMLKDVQCHQEKAFLRLTPPPRVGQMPGKVVGSSQLEERTVKMESGAKSPAAAVFLQ